MPNSRPRRIISSSLLAVEGIDEKNFFDSLLRNLGISDVQIEDVGGKDRFRDTFPALLKTSGFFDADGTPLVAHVAIVRDKDGDDAFQSVAGIVTAAGLEPPPEHGTYSEGNPKIGVFIMPGNMVEGTMLEDLCLKTVESHPEMECVDAFASCVSALETKPKNISKARAQAYLAAQPNSELKTKNSELK